MLAEALARLGDEHDPFNPHNAVARLLCARSDLRRVLTVIRAALRDGRLTPEQVGSAVGLRVELLANAVCITGARLAVAPEDAAADPANV